MRVRELWRFPVKSLQGEQVGEIAVDERGFVGDRRYALIDVATGVALTARRDPILLDGAAVWCDDGSVNVCDSAGKALVDDGDLGAWVGHPVRLTAARDGVVSTYEMPVDAFDDASEVVSFQGAPGTFHDSARTQISLISRSTLRSWDRRRFRMNVVVDGDGEDALIGSTVRIGTAVLEVVKRVSRCVLTTRAQPGGIERDLSVLRTINREHAGCLGVGTLVHEPGCIAVGDDVEILG
jgi:uncharacterized protein YcbX